MDQSSKEFDETRLLDEIRLLTNPRTPAALIEEACGLFVPGFTALPSVSIASAKPSRASTGPETFSVGRLYALELDYTSFPERKSLLTFFSPIENMEIAPVQFLVQAPLSKSTAALQVELRGDWERRDLYFAWLPWGMESTNQGAKIDALSRISELSDVVASNLQVFLMIDEIEIPLRPVWGLGTWVPSPSVESIIFPVNYARRLIEPYIFRLRLSSSYTLPDGNVVSIPRRSVMLHFRFPEGELARLYSVARLGSNAADGFHVVGNAVPLMNIDLKAWEPDTTYGDFVKTSNMKPLGFAGIVSFKRSSEFISIGKKSDDDEILHLPYSTQFSIRYNEDGTLVSQYGLPDSVSDTRDEQLLFWMTYGAEINGLKFKYTEAEQIQPRQVTTQSFRQAETLVPCFGGYNCSEADQTDLYNSIVLSYAAPPQILMYRDSLLYCVRDLLSRLGYGDHRVTGPSIEIRVVEGIRQRVTVVYIDDNISNPLKKQHLTMLQDHIDQRAPLGARIMIEIRRA